MSIGSDFKGPEKLNMTTDDDWVKAALVDDSIVVDLLIRLNHPPPPTKSAPPLHWSVRQRRSKPLILPPKKPASTRESPTTPLSWSGATATSISGSAGGVEESSRPPPNRSDLSRSKVNGTRETTPSKRLRKKKTLAELKDDEIVLLKERRHLKRELATLSITLEKQRTENESLKKMKLDLQSQPKSAKLEAVASGTTISNERQQKKAVSEPIPINMAGKVPSHDCFEAQKENINKENKFVLPDLNLPVGDEFSPEGLCGMS